MTATLTKSCYARHIVGGRSGVHGTWVGARIDARCELAGDHDGAHRNTAALHAWDDCGDPVHRVQTLTPCPCDLITVAWDDGRGAR